MIEKILKQLPQTQCEECGYKGCRPYAEAIAKGEAIDLCAPGGQVVLKRLEKVTQRAGDSKKVDSRYISPKLAKIDQAVCIGCTKCIRPCPTNAIVGTKKRNHFVLSSDCTGCGLCIDTCPVDCITMEEDKLSYESKLKLSDAFRDLYENNLKQEEGLSVKKPEDMKSLLNEVLGKGNESS